ncbi:50S ribosomal protein L25/general stress protein Ctc [Orrella sp. JC864]|uniref:50S ribosomal protein L25/general stress protein Ctc n=1 Tax=Orrella sp. JC864 TaxID=3120298 RepID=UPI0012BC6DE4
MNFTATKRSEQGSSASRRLRRAGRVPAIVYGAGAEPLAIDVDHNDIYHALRKEEFHSSVLKMQLEGESGTQDVLLRDVQWHPYKKQVLHIDFQRVDARQALHTKVPLHFINEDVSPAVKLGHAMINHVMTELEVSCLPADLPQFIEVDLSAIETGQSVHVADLKLPQGVTYVVHGGDANPVVATAVLPASAVSDESAEGEQGGDKPAA